MLGNYATFKMLLMNLLTNSFSKYLLLSMSVLLLLSSLATSTFANSDPDKTLDGCEGVVHLAITLDDNAEEISWTLVNTEKYVKVADGEYFTIEDNFETIETSVCLTKGCYELTIYDSWGDGICNKEVDDIITLMDQNGDVILNSTGNFGDYITVQFCTEQDGVIATPDNTKS